MKIAIIGIGYVGLVSAACFADAGLEVVCIDNDAQKIDNLKKGTIPIYEPGLTDIVLRNTSKGRLQFTTSIAEGIQHVEAVFIAVGTPMGPNGEADLSAVYAVAEAIGNAVTHNLIVVDKSTVPIGTADEVSARIQNALIKRNLPNVPEVEVVSNPEFLKEGVAINDFIHPDRVVIGVRSKHAAQIMHKIYRSFMVKSDRLITMDVRSAEMTKYASNCMLATKISFINEMASICEAVGADITKVRQGLCADSRIGNSFLYPGCGYGGSCFPKDVRALMTIATTHGVTPSLIRAVDETNQRQKQKLSQKLAQIFPDLHGKTIAIWGLSFKPNTDDMRESPAIETIRFLALQGAKIRAYDPVAMEAAQKIWLKTCDITYTNDMYETLIGADALVLHTEWSEFRIPDIPRMKQLMAGNYIFDGRNILPHTELTDAGFCHIRIGVNLPK